MALVRGIDVSRWQTVTSWKSVRGAGYRYVFIKATEGSTYLSKTFFPYYRDARAAGLLVGAYHFARPGGTSAKSQAAWFVKQLQKAGFKSGRDLPPVLDIEDDGGKSKAGLTSWCLDFLREVDSRLGLKESWKRTGVYCNRNFRYNEMDGRAVLQGRWLWYAYWPGTGQPTQDSQMPAGSAVWQWTDRGRVPGIKENTDLNVARAVDLGKMTGGGGSVEPVRRWYALRKPLPIPPAKDGAPVPRSLIFDTEWADPSPASHSSGGASYLRKNSTGWTTHELAGMRVEGMKLGDQYQIQIVILDPEGENVLWSSVLTEGRATSGGEHTTVVRSLRSRVNQRVRWRFLYMGAESDVKVTRADWLLEEY